MEIVNPQGGTVLDVATGAGHTAYAFAPFVARVIATDITPDMLRVTRSAAAERNIDNLQVLFAMAEALPFGNSKLDGVTCRLGAHHFENVHGFVREAHRALAKGGWFLLADTIGSEDDEADDKIDALERIRDPSHVRDYKRSFWVDLVRELGFTVTHDEVHPKELDAEDWMERLSVSDTDRAVVREMIETAKGRFAEYLKPDTREGRLLFHLDELTLFCRK